VKVADAAVPPPKTRPVATEFLRDGFRHVQVRRHGRAALYEKSKQYPHGGPTITSYEVVILRAQRPHPQDRTAAGWDRVESYPSSEEWGSRGWTYVGLAEAEKRLERISLP
jgi:hypothetical protein